MTEKKTVFKVLEACLPIVENLQLLESLNDKTRPGWLLSLKTSMA